MGSNSNLVPIVPYGGPTLNIFSEGDSAMTRCINCLGSGRILRMEQIVDGRANYLAMRNEPCPLCRVEEVCMDPGPLAGDSDNAVGVNGSRKKGQLAGFIEGHY